MVSVKPSLAVKIGKLELPYPTLMGSGCYGSGEEYAPFVDLSKVGAIVLKSVTRLPRLGNPTPRLVHTPAGMLNAIGLQNPGIDWYLEHELHKYADRPCKLIGSVAGFSIDDYAYVCERLAARDEIAAIELNVSCPNVASEGETFGCDAGLTARVVRAARSTTDKTLIVKLSPERHLDCRGRLRGRSGGRRRAGGYQHRPRDGDRRRELATAPRKHHRRSLRAGDSPDCRAGRLRSRSDSKDSDRRSRRHRKRHRCARVLPRRGDGDFDRHGETSPIPASPSASWRSWRNTSRGATFRGSTRLSVAPTSHLQRPINTKEMRVNAWPS